MAYTPAISRDVLKKRMFRIMSQSFAGKHASARLLLNTVGLVAVAAMVIFGFLHGTPSRAQSQSTAAAPQAQAQSSATTAYVYEVASIKPNKSVDNRIRVMIAADGLSAMGTTLQALIGLAYDVRDHQLSGVPGWARSDKYDIEAKMDGAVADEVRKLTPDQSKAATQQMLQALLADRFKLAVHRETTEQPVYALVIAKNGPKIHEAKPDDTYPNGFKGPDGKVGHGMMMGGNGSLTGQGVPITNLVKLLSRLLGRNVIDKTGLAGNYDFTLKFAPDQGPAGFGGPGGNPAPSDAAPPDSSGPSIFTAVEEQLGLKLEPQKGPVEMIVIDHVEKPSEN